MYSIFDHDSNTHLKLGENSITIEEAMNCAYNHLKIKHNYDEVQEQDYNKLPHDKKIEFLRTNNLDIDHHNFTMKEYEDLTK